MTTSGTYAYGNSSLGSLALVVFDRCQIRRTGLTPQHLESLYQEANLLQSDWSADGIVWWKVGSTTQALTQATATYTVTPSYVTSVLDLYITGSGSVGQNRLITPFSRTDFASLANPTQQGFPTSFWWNRLINSTITLWPVPDGVSSVSMTYYYYTQPEDAKLAQGTSPNIPYWWMEAYVSDLAWRMARSYAPQLEQQRKADKIEAYQRASKQVETSQIYITPGLSSYFR